MNRLRLYSILAGLCLLILLPHNSFALSDNKDNISPDNNQGKAILIIIDRIGWKDIQDAETPNLDRLTRTGAVGLMTTNTGGVLSQNNSYLTLGTGARVVGLPGSWSAVPYGQFYKGERIENLIFQITGKTMNKGSIGNPSIAKIHRVNADKPYRVNIGALGTALKEGGIRISVLGNCDNYKDQSIEGNGKNYAIAMMMDDNGIVPMGDIGSNLISEDPGWPMGIRTDYDELMRSFNFYSNHARLIAVELGDTSRAEDFRHQVMDSRIEYYKTKALEETDKFLGRLLNHFDDEKDFLIVLTPVGPAKDIGDNNRLTPIIAAGKGIERGFLTSGSTHREGVVTNLDVGASIINYFNLRPLAGQAGTPIYSVKNNSGMEGISGLNERLVAIYNQRPFLIKGYVYTLIPILALAAAFLIFKRNYIRWIKTVLLFVMIIPFVYLILPLVQAPHPYAGAITALSIGIVMTAIIIRLFRTTIDRVMVVSGITVLTLILDQGLGMRLIQASPLGYDVIAGARFYGMGNEYMGVLIGAVCCAGASIMERLSHHKPMARWIFIIIGLICLFCLASPRLGANVGGTIAIFVALFAILAITGDKRIHFRNLTIAGILMVAMIAGVFYLDSLQAIGSQSHMGQTAMAIRENGMGELIDIFYRKLSMNFRLLKTTVWTRVFLTSFGVIVLLLYRPVGIFYDVYKRYSLFIKGLTGGAIGAIAALLANDSGIVAAATAMIFVASPFILLIMDEAERKVAEGIWEDGIQFKTTGR
ncbi:MAG: hypothetical protein GX352_09440 [Clostridiales bacterium]|nr:hypothetical protein [Clostridiales bacterium]